MTTYAVLESFLLSCPLPFVGLFTQSTVESELDNYLGDFCGLLWYDDHWILVGRFGGAAFYLDTNRLQQAALTKSTAFPYSKQLSALIVIREQFF